LLAAVGRDEPGRSLADADLLARFAESKDEAAFEALVWRHGPMVRAVCRQVLGPRPDADDAFQATFLVLARKAALLRTRGAVGGWLYTVAGRVARKLRRRLARREPTVEDLTMVPEKPGGPHPQNAESSDLRAVLDEEIARLPEKYRLVIQLCYAAGHTTAEAGRRLGVPKGTVLTRLAWARRRLQDRLAGRGVTAGVGAFGTALGGAALDPQLVRATVRTATLLAGGAAVAPHVPLHLSEGVIRDMAISKLKLTVWVLVVAVAAAGVGVGRWAAPAAAGGNGEEKPAVAKKADPPPRVTTPKPAMPPVESATAAATLEDLQQQIKAMQLELSQLRQSEKGLTKRLEDANRRDFQQRQSVEYALPPQPAPGAARPTTPPSDTIPPPPVEFAADPLIGGPIPPAHRGPVQREQPTPVPVTEVLPSVAAPNPIAERTGPKQYIVSRPVGDWHRAAGEHQFGLKFDADRLVATNIVSTENGRVSVTIEADYSISRDGVVFGYITGIDVSDGTDNLAGYVDQPFSFRFRADDEVLTVKDVKVASKAADDAVLFVAGRYTDKPSTPILPPVAKPSQPKAKPSRPRGGATPPAATTPANPIGPLAPAPSPALPGATPPSSPGSDLALPGVPGVGPVPGGAPAPSGLPPGAGGPPFNAPVPVQPESGKPTGPEPQQDPFRRPDGSSRLLGPGNGGISSSGPVPTSSN
jgi:RNA polymerase sigma factor (sigma-70 family)